MANASSPGDLDSLARQYWDTWSGLLGVGLRPEAAEEPAPAAFDWYARMQQLAAQFAEGGGSAAEIAAAWRQMLGGQDGSPFAGVFQGLPGGMGAAVAGWPDQVRPFVEAVLRPLRQQASEWFGRPGLGPAREHQQRLQALAAAWQEWEERNEAFTALLSRIGQDAFARFERLLEQRQENAEQQLASARALFDLWIDAAEEAWAEAALSEEYQQQYAALTNALMRVRQGLQQEVERLGALLGLPGRSEVDAVHRKVAELERSVRELRRGAGLARNAAAVPGATPRAPRKEKAAAAPAGAGRPAARKAAPRKATATGAKAGGDARARSAQAPKAAAKASAKATRSARPAAPKKAAAAKSAAAPKARASARAKPAVAKKAAAKKAVATPKKPAARKAAATRTPAPAAASPRPAQARARKAQPAGGAQVVSIKDWVNRNLATGKAGGSRGGRGG